MSEESQEVVEVVIAVNGSGKHGPFAKTLARIGGRSEKVTFALELWKEGKLPESGDLVVMSVYSKIEGWRARSVHLFGTADEANESLRAQKEALQAERREYRERQKR